MSECWGGGGEYGGISPFHLTLSDTWKSKSIAGISLISAAASLPHSIAPLRNILFTSSHENASSVFRTEAYSQLSRTHAQASIHSHAAALVSPAS